jgi:hypothetical protein
VTSGGSDRGSVSGIAVEPGSKEKTRPRALGVQLSAAFLKTGNRPMTRYYGRK